MDADEDGDLVSVKIMTVIGTALKALSVVLALTVWSFYVVVGRVCTSMIRNRSSSGLGKATGGKFPSFIPIVRCDLIWLSRCTGRLCHLMAHVYMGLHQGELHLGFSRLG